MVDPESVRDPEIASSREYGSDNLTLQNVPRVFLVQLGRQVAGRLVAPPLDKAVIRTLHGLFIHFWNPRLELPNPHRPRASIGTINRVM